MATKAKGKLATAKRDAKTPKPDDTERVAIAQALSNPIIQAAITPRGYAKQQGDATLSVLVKELASQAKAANDGDLGRAEAMLMVQAHTLDAIFNNLAGRAITAEYMDTMDRYLRLALKAQSQCRATLETLAVIKNPPNVAFVKQANIAHNQQVNNALAIPSRAGEIETEQSKLLEAKPYERLDIGTADAAVGTDSPLEAVGAIDRAANR